MAIENRPVTSREYKLMLDADRFAKRKQGTEAFLQLVEFLVTEQGGTIEERQDDVTERRTWYLDTEGRVLRRNGFVLRVRREREGNDGGFKVTLKYRASDRYLSAAKNVSSTMKGETKFEEDITPPFVSRFSLSTSIKVGELPKLEDMNDLERLFPGLNDLEVSERTPVGLVNGFRAHEIALKVGKLKFKKKPLVKAALSFWYLLGESNEIPLIGEFSFDYDEPNIAKRLDEKKGVALDQIEQFPYEVVEGTNRFFDSLRKQTGWMNPADTATKTAYAYEGL